MGAPKTISRRRKVFRWLGLLFGGVLVLCLLGLGGALLWLRSSQAEAYLSGLLVRLLAEQGYTLTFDGFSGPLPEHLLLRGATIADKDGPLLRMKELEVDIFLSSLLTNTAELSLLLREPELLRLPSSAESAPAEPAGRVSYTSVPLPRLPVDARVRELRLEDAVLPLSALLGGDIPAPPAVFGPAPGRVTVDADGGMLLSGGTLTADIDADLTTDAGQTLKLRLRATLDETGGALDLSGRFAAPAPAQGPPPTVEYALDVGAAQGELTLKRLYVAGLGLEINLSGRLHPDEAKASLLLAATAADKAAWQDLLAELAGFTAEEDFGGALAVNADVTCEGLPGFGAEKVDAAAPALPRLSGKVDLRGRDMRWPFPEGRKLLGPEVDFTAVLSGDGKRILLLKLEEARAAGFRLSGEAAAFGKAPDAPPDPWPVGPPQTRTPAAGPAGFESFTANLSLDVADLAALDAGVSGPAAITLGARGSLAEMTALLELSAPELRIPAGALQRLEARLGITLRRSDAGDLFGDGAVSASVGQSPGGPGDLAVAWRAELPAGEGETTFALDGLRARFAGAEVTGDCAVALPGAGAAGGGGADGAAGLPPHLSGDLAVTVSDWKGLAAVSGLPLRGSPAKLNLHLDEAQGQSAALTMNVDSFTLDGQVALRNLALDAKAERLWTDPALRGTLRAGPGEAGPLRWGSATANLEGRQAGTFNLALTGGGAAGKAGKAAPARSGGGGEILGLAGSYDLGKEQVVLSRFAFNSPDRKTGVRLASPVTVSYAGGVGLKGLQLAFTPKGSLAADADLRPGSLRLAAKLKEFSPAFLGMFTSAPLPDGVVSADLAYSQSSAGPKGNLNVQVRVAPSSLPGLGATPAANAKAGSFQEKPGDAILRVDSTIGHGAGGLALRGTGSVSLAGTPASDVGKLQFSVPLSAGADGLPLPNNSGPLSASLVWEGSVAPLWRLAPLPGRSLDGRFSADLKVSGTPAAPVAAGSVYLAGGRYEDKLLGVLLTDITLESHADPKGGAKAVLAAGDGRGGTAAVQFALSPEAVLSLHGQLRHLRPLHRDDLSLTLSGILNAKGDPVSLSIGADILVEEGELNLMSSMGGGGVRTLEIGEAGKEPEKIGAGPSLALRIEVPRRFFIRGQGLDSEWQGKLRITGNAAAPQLLGSLHPVRGTLDLLSKTFVFDKGEIVFTGGNRINPGINLELVNEAPDLTAVIKVGGNANKPKLELTSRPPLPRDEVLAHVLFGKDVSELSRFEALQLANGVRELAGAGEGGGVSALTTMRKSLGLDMLRVGGGDAANTRTTSGMSGDANAPGLPAGQTGGNKAGTADTGLPSLEAGKYINDSIYVGVEQGASPESTGVRVEIELTPHINLQGKTSPSSSQLGVGWKMDY